MEVTEAKLFNFNTIVEGQPFGFSIMANSRTEAAEILRRRLSVIINELGALESLKKCGNSN